MQFRIRFIGLVACLAALLAAGCASIGASRGISTSLVNLVPRVASLFESNALLTLRITNETTTPLALTGAVHKLYLDDTYVGQAVSNDRTSVAALGTTTQTVTVHFENLALLRKMSQYSAAPPKVIGYRVESLLYASEKVGPDRFKAIATGELDVAALMSAAGVPASGGALPAGTR